MLEVHSTNPYTLFPITTNTWHNKPGARFSFQPGFTIALLSRFLDELKLNRNLSCVGNSQGLLTRLDKFDSSELYIRHIHHHLKQNTGSDTKAITYIFA